MRPAPAIGGSVRDLVLPQGELDALPKVAHALGGSSCRNWTMSGLLETLGDWFLAQSDEGRRLQNDHASERLRLNRELTSLRKVFERQTVAYEHAMYNGDCYRHEREGLHSSRSAPVPEDNSPQRDRASTAVRNPYASYGTDVPPSSDLAPDDPTLRRGIPNARLALLSLQSISNEVPLYTGYSPLAFYGSGLTGAGDGTNH